MNEIKGWFEFIFGERLGERRTTPNPDFERRQRERGELARELAAQKIERDAREDIEIAETGDLDVLKERAEVKLRRAEEYRRGERSLLEAIMPPEYLEGEGDGTGEI